MPQTDGQAAATYHAEHAIRAARTSPDDEPKVVVERTPLGETFRMGRMPAPVEPETKTWMDAGAASAQPLVGRIAVAVVAGLAVVAVIFVTLQRQSARGLFAAPVETSADARSTWAPSATLPARSAATSGTAVILTPPPAPVDRLAPAPSASDIAAVNDPGIGGPASNEPAGAPGPSSADTANASAPGASAPMPTAGAQSAHPLRPRPKPVGSAPPAVRPKAGDLGEFKSTF